MSLDCRTVDEELCRRTARVRKRVEEVHPDTLGGPANIAIVEGLAGTINARRVDPACARLQHMHDAADPPPIIDARLAPRAGRQMRCDPRQLLVCQPEMVATHRRPSSGRGEPPMCGIIACRCRKIIKTLPGQAHLLYASDVMNSLGAAAMR